MGTLPKAKKQAIRKASAPTESDLSGIPMLDDCLDTCLDALGIDVTVVEGGL